MKIVSLLFLALTACSMTPVRDARSEDNGGLPLPPARAALEFPAGAQEVHMYELVLGLARLTGCELALDPNTQQALQASRIALASDAPVPADEVYSFVETFLARQGFSLSVLKLGSRPIVGVFGHQTPPNGSPEPLFVQESQLSLLQDHPALLVRLAVTFRNIDTRQLQTQLRQLLVDPSGLRQCVPAGERSMILQGPGREMLALVELLREVDAATAAPAPLAPPSDKAQAPPR